ncbi:MAG TPA: MarR family transcriptional regulator [Solirubrobacteraceae bacterium]|nr:MarR family transcriptional regulator [Solirubrobacteraceae bacterium]
MPAGAQPPGLHGALTRNTGYLLSRLGMYAQRHFSERMAALGLTPRKWGLLNVLDAEDGVSQQQLGRAVGMDPSTMVAAIDELEAAGLAQRHPHPSDRRAHAVYLTELGQTTLARGRREARDAGAELFAPLSADERAQLHDMLLRMAQAAHERSDAGGPPL